MERKALMARRLPWLSPPKKIYSTVQQKDIRSIRDSREWRDRVRPEQLRRCPYCQHCDAKGRLKEAKDVDHIIPLSQGGEPFDYGNLQSLCKRCHIAKTAEEQKNERRIG